ncbi:hypothetical protein DXG01_007893 [Tephrocybe rancida]|nr:hypothetical protein DXG01_007893 [Tephrocybe rancida]
MAKSIRSKAKRTFRNKKREDGVYAATEAARLHRLNAKLVATTSKDREGDIHIQNVEGVEDDILGWCWLTTFGLLDPGDITLESMEALTCGETVLRDQQFGRGNQEETPKELLGSLLMESLQNAYLRMDRVARGEKNGERRKD